MIRKRFIVTLMAAAALLSSAGVISSCQPENFNPLSGQPIRFTAATSGSAFGTKASYSGVAESGKENIYWQTGDTLRIYCAQASEPSAKYADYKVTELVTPGSQAKIDGFGGVGLRWGDNVDHVFFAVYPSPAVNGKSADALGNGTLTANIPATQVPVSLNATAAGSEPDFTAVPDLKSEYMVAVDTIKKDSFDPDAPVSGEGVFLNFKPIVTAIEFTIKNAFANDGNLNIKNIQLISASHNIAGGFTADLTKLNIAGGAYPTCTSTSGGKTVTMDFTTIPGYDYSGNEEIGGSKAYVTVEKDQTLRFTFFLKPEYASGSAVNVDDLTFKIVRADNSWLSTKLAYNDASKTGIAFPCHKKTYVKGILVPEGAQWTVKYDPTVQSWNTGTCIDINPIPETGGDPFVTSWDTENGIDDELTLEPKENNDLLPGMFSVSATEYVNFSRGNLQAKYNAATTSYTWGFATNQYDIIGNTAGNTKIKNDGSNDDGAVVDLFGWSTAATNYGIDISTNNNTYSGEFKDWSTAFNISGLCTLSKIEWDYLLYQRIDAVNKYGLATLLTTPNVNGVVILPDEWTLPGGCTFTPGANKKYATNEYNLDAWAKMEQAGAVFLPAAGYRDAQSISNLALGYYWSGTASSKAGHAYRMNFSDNGVAEINDQPRFRGQSVRLVRKFDKPHDAVYIGGKWWATMNVGATTVAGSPATCYGDYFAWGETESYYSSITISNTSSVTFNSWKNGKSAGYAWASYRHCTGAEKTLTKYNDDSVFGTVIDNKTILESADDAATSNWGETWRTPTIDDFIALCVDCGCTFENYSSTLKTGGTSSTTDKGVYWCDNYDGVPGVLFSNGTNKVFFPAAGRCSGTTNDSGYAGKVIRYWSSRVYKKGEKNGSGGNAWGLFSDYGELKYDGYGPRQQGRSIRPVHD